MKPEGITTTLFLAKLRARVKELGGPAKTARAWGITPQRITNVMAGDKLPGPTILEEMEYEFVKDISYRYKRVK